ncbi:MarR family winged helix-turn-helix transcriptional regulator [Enemella sp. A6]|uniref:MarR family winged helix-turn-helix transcriptional regulator n=1 Tax=Enemella sp. A6 TaxID=3440152 RepID=UPI003EBDF42D
MTSNPNDPGGLESTAAEASWQVHKLIVAAAVLDVVLGRRLGLHPVDYQAMKHLLTSANPMGTVELGNLVGLTSGSATGLVDRLERAGHLRRTDDPRDRRRLILQPTKRAIDLAMSDLNPLDSRVQEILADYTPEERGVITRFLQETAQVFINYADETAELREQD